MRVGRSAAVHVHQLNKYKSEGSRRDLPALTPLTAHQHALRKSTRQLLSTRELLHSLHQSSGQLLTDAERATLLEAVREDHALADALHAGSGDTDPYSGPVGKDPRSVAAKSIQKAVRGFIIRSRIRKLFNAQVIRRIKRQNDIGGKVKEICIYLWFLLFFTLSSIVIVQNQDIFHFGNHIREQLVEKEFSFEHSHVRKTFQDIATWEEFYQWMEGPFYQTLYTGATMDGGPDNEYPGYVFGTNRLVGAVRLGTLRAAPRACDHLQMPVTENSVTRPLTCYGDANGNVNDETESKEDYGLGERQFTWGGWNTTVEEVQAERDSLLSTYRTGHDRVYMTPAFWVLLPNYETEDREALQLIHELRDGHYADEQTRVMYMDATFYNPMLNYWMVFRATIEATKAGGLLVSAQQNTVRLYTFFESEALSWLIIECVVILFFLYFIWQQIVEIRVGGKKYLQQLSTLAHNANIVAYLMVWAFRIMSIAYLPPVEGMVMDAYKFYPVRLGATFKSISVYFNSLNAFLCWFKLVRYLSYIPRFALVTGTLVKSGKGVTGFAVIFIVVFYGFAAAHMMTFGPRLAGYRNLTASVYTLLKSLLGEFDLDELTQAQWFMGPLFFVLFIALAVFVVLNVLIAIISDAYSEQSAEQDESADLEVGREMKDYILAELQHLPFVQKAQKASTQLSTAVNRRTSVIVHKAQALAPGVRSRRITDSEFEVGSRRPGGSSGPQLKNFGIGARGAADTKESAGEVKAPANTAVLVDGRASNGAGSTAAGPRRRPSGSRRGGEASGGSSSGGGGSGGGGGGAGKGGGSASSSNNGGGGTAAVHSPTRDPRSSLFGVDNDSGSTVQDPPDWQGDPDSSDNKGSHGKVLPPLKVSGSAGAAAAAASAPPAPVASESEPRALAPIGESSRLPGGVPTGSTASAAASTSASSRAGGGTRGLGGVAESDMDLLADHRGLRVESFHHDH